MRSNAAAHSDEMSSIRFWDRVLFSVLILWTFVGMCFTLYDTDFWWHLKTGEWILAGNGIPYVDLYTFTDADKPWIDLHWGFQVLITLLYRLGGIPLVTLVKAAVYTASVTIAWNACGDRLAAWKKAALWILPIICISGRGNERPEMLTQLFLAVWLWLACRTDRRPNWIWYLPLVQLIWVNCHALFILGLVVGFCYGVDAVVRHLLTGRLGLEPRVAGPSLRMVGIVAVVVGIVCFLNPYFEEGVFFPWTLYRKFSVEKEFLKRSIAAFMKDGSTLGVIYLVAELGTWLATTGSFVWLFWTRRRWSPFRLLLFAGFSHLAWQATRNTNIFALVSAFVACENFADAQRSSTGSASIPFNLPSMLRITKRMVAVVVVLCLAVVSGLWNQIAERNKPFRLGEAPYWFIHDAARFAGQPGFPKRAFVSNIGQSDVYVYHNGPEHKVFMDARLEVCSQETFENHNRILISMARGSTSWESLFRADGLPVVILDSRGQLTREAINGMFSIPTWRLVFADRTAAVFLPTELAEQLGLPQAETFPLKYPDGPPPAQINQKQ